MTSVSDITGALS